MTHGTVYYAYLRGMGSSIFKHYKTGIYIRIQCNFLILPLPAISIVFWIVEIQLFGNLCMKSVLSLFCISSWNEQMSSARKTYFYLCLLTSPQ